ncbi:putative hydrolase [Aquisphaera giovannonii]|uniref:Putative hydrolase n=1 Tax=Aquisphaera giovannonii TaxID=406548 RepID=A0A5B9WDI6_9BACT|nr:alpha/beta fold hydrolase [Aquisphaera giovannonii]QEH37950.1 putative hydrolase [Aquisphaera giovannonii]
MSIPLRATIDDRREAEAGVPPFEPPPWLRNAHAQTVAGRYLLRGDIRVPASRHEIDLGDGDRLCVLETIPPDWSRGDPAAMLVHGLGSCARAPYMARIAGRLAALGVRVARMNLRGAGDGFGLARGIYHAGRTGDVRLALAWLGSRAPGSPIALAGFSLGGNLALKLAGEAAVDPVPGLDCVLAANPPVDLAASAATITRPQNRLYDWNFTSWLRREVRRLHGRFPDLGRPDLRGVRSVRDFDQRYTAARNGFSCADDYYERSSARAWIARTTLPGLVVHAADDPFIPAESFAGVAFPRPLEFEMTRHGGHLGYLSRRPWHGDHRWLDVRFAAWLADRWGLPADRLDLSAPRRTRRITALPGVHTRHA